MEEFKSMMNVVVSILFAVAHSVLMSAGILWAINTIFGTAFEMNIWAYLAIATTLMIVHQVSRNKD